ncbi:MAG TPA: tyrosine-type recombinase/integrase [Bryobacteraceae bacterium]|nr:tyrosine-type recombinase/integrase [Bryobacteraceae bacterium]
MVEQFIQARKYLKAVSPKTLIWYQCSFKAFDGAMSSKETINRRIVELRERGVSPITINSYLRCINAYLRWLHEEHQHAPLRIPRLKEEQKVLATLTPDHIKRLLQFSCKGRNLKRAHTLTLLLLDTGLRFAEALSLTWDRVDLDNLVLKVLGKGGKHRVVPISLECRKVLYRWKQQQRESDLVFPTRSGIVSSQRNVGRDVRLLGQRVGITGVRFSPHTFRHTFAVSYLRAGGNVLYLQRILGHSSLEMTNRYTRSLGIDDLSAVHSKLSLLSRRG